MKAHSPVVASVMMALSCTIAVGQQNAPHPISMGIVIDTSGSMGSKLGLARQFVSELLKPATPQDEFALIQASDQPIVLSELVSATETLQAKIAFTQSKGRSALLDAIYVGIQQTIHGRNESKVLVVISDGGDNSSRYTETAIGNTIREAGVRLYMIGVHEPVVARARTVEEAVGPALLSQIAENVGGRHFSIERGYDLRKLAADVKGTTRMQP